jgi:hypothetical protein
MTILNGDLVALFSLSACSCAALLCDAAKQRGKALRLDALLFHFLPQGLCVCCDVTVSLTKAGDTVDSADNFTKEL